MTIFSKSAKANRRNKNFPNSVFRRQFDVNENQDLASAYSQYSKEDLTNTKKNLVDLCVDFMLVFYMVSFMAPVLMYYNRYISVCFIGLFVLIYSNKFKRGEIRYSYFVEICPLLLHLFALYTFISAGWALDPALPIQKSFRLEFDAILLTFFYAYFREKEDYGIQNVQRLIGITGIVIALVIVFFVGIDKIQVDLQSSTRLSVDDSESYGGFYCNANSIATYMLVPITYFLVSFIAEGTYLKFIFMVPLVSLVFLTGSRQGTVGLFLVFSLVFSLGFIKYRKIKQLTFLLFGSLLAFAALNIFISLGFLENVSKRLEEMSEMSDTSSLARIEMLELGWKIFLANPLVGCGIACPEVINRETTGWAYLHNEYLELLAGGGLLGFFLYFSQYIIMGKTLVKSFFLKQNIFLVSVVIASSAHFLLLLLAKCSCVYYYDTVITFYSLPLLLSCGLLREKIKDVSSQKAERNGIVTSTGQKVVSGGVMPLKKRQIQNRFIVARFTRDVFLNQGFIWRLKTTITKKHWNQYRLMQRDRLIRRFRLMRKR